MTDRKGKNCKCNIRLYCFLFAGQWGNCSPLELHECPNSNTWQRAAEIGSSWWATNTQPRQDTRPAGHTGLHGSARGTTVSSGVYLCVIKRVDTFWLPGKRVIGFSELFHGLAGNWNPLLKSKQELHLVHLTRRVVWPRVLTCGAEWGARVLKPF